MTEYINKEKPIKAIEDKRPLSWNDTEAELAEQRTYDDIIGSIEGFNEEESDRINELMEADKEGRCLVLPCKVGDTINAFRFDIDKGLYVISDKVTSVTTNRNGYTIKTKEKFYPIKEKDGYDFAPISEYPGALADYYVGTKEEAEKALEGLE